MNTVRRSDIDIAKGFALFLVVLGHVVTMHHTIFRWIYAFHMPAFFFLSGMTFRPEKYRTCLDYVKRRGKSLILPYFGITLTALAVCTIRPYYHLAIAEYGWKHILTWIFYYGQPQQIYVGQLWFLPALFFAGLYAMIWLRIFDSYSMTVRAYALLILALAGTYIHLADPLIPVMHRLPWKLDSALCAAVFLLAGYYANRMKLLEKMTPYTAFLLPFFAVLSFFLGPKLSDYVNLCDCRYTAPPYYFGAAFSGIFALLLAAKTAAAPALRTTAFARFWRFCGRRSMLLFSIQSFALYFFVELILRTTGVELKPMEWMPTRLSTFALTAATFALISLIGWLWECFSRKKTERQPYDRRPDSHLHIHISK